jgi:predicted Zn-dependent peptidase
MALSARALSALVALAAPAVLAADPPPPAPATPPDAPAEGSTPDAAPAAPPLLPYEKLALDNGLEFIFHKDARVPVVCVSVWYHVGALHEEAGKTGFAHLFEHLMFNGSAHVPGDSHFKLLEAAGGSFMNGSTDFDRTNYFECVPKNELELALWLESDRMGWLMQGVDKAKLDNQRDVVKNERRQTLESQPYGLSEEKLWQAMFPKSHPYWGYVIGSMEDLDRASLDDVARFFDTYYAPSNATLSIVGDVELSDAQALVAKYFKSLPKWPKPAKKTVPAPALTAEVRLDVEDNVAQLPKVVVQYFTPPAFAPDNAELDVLARILGDGNGSRLHQALIVDSQLAQEVVAYQKNLESVSVLVLSAVVRPGANPEDALNAIQAQLDLLKDLPPSDEEIKRAVTSFETEQILDLQMLLDRGETLQHYNHATGDPGFLEKDIARMRAVTPETIQAAVDKYLAKDRRAVLIARPKGAPSTAPAPPPAPPPADGAAAPAPAPAGDAAKETK